ncbi:nucleotidyltransferase domain-containing protein [Tepidibacter formicigenes]|uniref:Nucleotidyltransferase domain-containing protein n=1 Tax=Tepidibacter formicigenes DSM 15518 TaxID=1123349 RepID=A0A1M6NJS0_9FIRM|nr:nucleotidyltransferase domain-containing protein [Tepidibacter formicigenes]SHJ95923.1 Nucleotidyltransferase domain-containing protein [Tepidibacter formicigenes DSM 15518]
MPQQIKSEINKITNQIQAVVSTSKIYLFGSFAYGKPNDDSDLDLCIVTNEKGVRKRELIKSIRKSISKVASMPVDILVYYEDEFDERAMLESTIEYKIAHEGVSVYEQ